MKRDLNLSIIKPIYNELGRQYEDSGGVYLVDSKIDGPAISGKNLVIQRIVLAIMNSPGSMLIDKRNDGGEWGGGVKNLLGRMARLKDTEIRVEISKIINRVEESILRTNTDFGEYEVESIELKRVDRSNRGFTVYFTVSFVSESIDDFTTGLPLGDILISENGRISRLIES